VKARGPRRQVDDDIPGIFDDAIGRVGIVYVGGIQRERRFPKGTAIREIQKWQRRKTRALRLGLDGLDADLDDLDAPPTSTPVAATETPLRTAIEAHLALMPEGTYKRDTKTLLEHWLVSPLGDTPVEALTDVRITAQLRAWVRDGVAPQTVNHRRRALSQLIVGRNGLDGPNPVRRSEKFEVPRAEPRGVPWPFVRRILVQVTPGTKTSARLWVMATTGIPQRQLERLLPSHLFLDAPKPYYVSRPRRKGRGAKGVAIGLTVDGVRAFERFVAANAWKTFSQASLYKSFKLAMRKARARWEAAEARAAAFATRARRPWPVPEDYHPYDLRHSFATDLYRRSRDLRAVQEVLQHADAKTTERYAIGAVSENAQAAIDALARRRHSS
jgi:integrase